MKQPIVAVYIRGLAFKCRAGSRRQQVLNQLKKQDEKNQDWLPLAFVATGVIALLIGGLIATIWPMA